MIQGVETKGDDSVRGWSRTVPPCIGEFEKLRGAVTQPLKTAPIRTVHGDSSR